MYIITLNYISIYSIMYHHISSPVVTSHHYFPHDVLPMVTLQAYSAVALALFAGSVDKGP